MDTAVYDQLPKELIIRAIKTKKRTIVTTLIDSIEYPRSEISGLYLMRWQIELDFRSIKTLMKMDILRCKSPDMVRKEIYVHLIVYNLIRALMVEASERQGSNSSRVVSFKAAQQTMQCFHVTLLLTNDRQEQTIIDIMCEIIGEHTVGNRSVRSEPRAIKRRPKPFPILMHSRKQAKRMKKYNE